MNTTYHFTSGGMVQECGIADGDRVRPIKNDAEFKAWKLANPSVNAWKSVDGRRMEG